MLTSATTLLALAATASAHFTLLYPPPRGNSFRAPASQWIYPCAGLNSSESSPRTLWPLTGGAVAYNNSHEHVYAVVNLGVGNNTSTFNYSLVDSSLVSVNGAGVFCLPDLTLPSTLSASEGTNASIQVITLSTSGASLYNCADITLSANAPVVNSSVCTNATGITADFITAGSHSGSHSHDSANSTNTTSGATTSTTPKSAASGFSSSAVSTVVVGVAAVVMSYFL